jgi:DNA-binding Lrp family transcriptional regulator
VFKITKGIKMEVPYFQVPNAVFDAGLDKHELLVYFYLARCGNQGARAFPSYNTIAKKCGISRSTTIKTVKSLEQKQIVRKEIRYCIERSQNYSNVYIVEHDLGGGVQQTPGSVYGKLGSVCAEPYKELDYKEQNKKNIYINLPIDGCRFLKIYNEHFFAKFGKNHMRITEEQLHYITENIEDLKLHITEEEFEEGVVEHFGTLATNNNGNILAFIPTLRRRFDGYNGY